MRRKLMLAAMLTIAGLPGLARAQQASPGMPLSSSGVVLVELVNFHCQRCRAVNDHYDRMAQAAAASGIPLRFAPVAWTGQSIWPDRVYYAVRDLFPAAEGLVRNALFDGIQREGQRFEEVSQVVAYLERRQVPQQALALDPKFSMLAIADRAVTDTTLLSEMKAGRLLDLSGATEVPAFVWVRDGNVVDTISPSDAAEPTALVQRVIRKLSEPTK